jgi:hypothetical protein
MRRSIARLLNPEGNAPALILVASGKHVSGPALVFLYP